MASKFKKDHKYTDAEKDFLRKNIKSLSYQELADLFNLEFGTDCTHGQISDVCIKRLGIKREANTGGFKKGKQTTRHTLPIGAEIESGKHTWVKISDTCILEQHISASKGMNPNWKLKQEVVWEQANGEKPKNKLIVFLDKNNRNYSLDNLYCTDRAVNFMMAKNGWYSTDRDITLTAIKWCELFYAINPKESENGYHTI